MSGSIKTTRVLAFASGKGGVGKTLLSLNTAVALARQHHSVVLFDGDMGLANVHVLLGTQPRATVADVLAGRCDLAQTMFVGPEGIKIIHRINTTWQVLRYFNWAFNWQGCF